MTLIRALCAIKVEIRGSDPACASPHGRNAALLDRIDAWLSHHRTQDWTQEGRAMPSATDDPLATHDQRRGILRLAFVENGRMSGALFVAAEPAVLSRSDVTAALGMDCVGDIPARHAPGRPTSGPWSAPVWA